MYVTTINAQKGSQFEGEQKGECGKVWREKREGRNDGVIVI